METYELVLMSVMMANYLLFVMLHFAGEWRREYRDMLATRLSCGEMFWSCGGYGRSSVDSYPALP
jgi:hypothetical protein